MVTIADTRRRSQRIVLWRVHFNKDVFFLAPIMILYGVALLLPLAITVGRSIELGVPGFVGIFNDPLVIHAALNTVVYSASITIIVVVLAYTVAAAIWRSGYVGRIVITLCVLLSFWTSVMVKVVAWNAILRNNGILNSALLYTGLIKSPLKLYPDTTAVLLGMIQYTLPFAVFPILGVMMRIDRRLELAAESLGSNGWRVFGHVVLPLTLPGVLASSLLVFVLTTGFYVIPAAMGSPRDAMMSNVVALYALKLVDFRVASGVAVLLLIAVSLLTVVYQRLERRVQ